LNNLISNIRRVYDHEEPEQKEKADAWAMAFGLQDVNRFAAIGISA